ncbi:CHAD domain-containing protein [Novosphingobium sediminicola]|uniref:Inorganic triphosphatase YgiF n=1 Tax=Novosphingobium sediminicola TaxID=563162 RepID=A0A7W6G8F4_9SPHN|nr:CHAD domain-containing protein [Novosphingobium sediminicola]MBB3957160.1 inorganic triphosphatase YgiF [Novosphingobium sediminicola]
MTREIELKLDLTPSAAEALEGSTILGGKPERIPQRSVYFDTSDHALSMNGFSLRIRRSGRKRTQTIKADRAFPAGLFVRSEWERTVRNDRPVLDDTTPVPTVLGVGLEELAPVFEVRIARSVWKVKHDDALIELVLDRGEATTDDRISPICEIELELKSGTLSALFSLARHIDSVAPVRLGVQTKAERGYRLIGPAICSFKAEAVRLSKAMTAGQAFQHIVQNCIRQFRLNEAMLLTHRDVEALHQARVALRRLRSSFSIFKPLLAGAEEAKLDNSLRRLATKLGDARNLDVLLERARPGLLHDHLEAARDKIYSGVIGELASPRPRSLMLDLAEWLSSGDWRIRLDTCEDRDQPAREFAIAALERLRRKLRKHGRDLAAKNDAARHQIRKDAKKLRYAATFFVSLFERKHEPQRYEAFLIALEKFQDLLGSLNDLATAPSVLERLGLADLDDAAVLLAGHKKGALLKAASDAYDALSDTHSFWR